MYTDAAGSKAAYFSGGAAFYGRLGCWCSRCSVRADAAYEEKNIFGSDWELSESSK